MSANNKHLRTKAKRVKSPMRVSFFLSNDGMQLLVKTMGHLTVSRGERFTMTSTLEEAIRALAERENIN